MYTETTKYLSMPELQPGLDHIRQSPQDQGELMMIVIRPNIDERTIVDKGTLHPHFGLLGDTWQARGSKHTPDGSANINTQITIMNARLIDLLAQSQERWPLAGDQLYVDLNMSDDNLPPGTRLAIGSAILEVSAELHSGCKKFSDRFGVDALKFVNSPEGKQLHLRGINTSVIQGGEIRVGEVVKKI